MPRNRAPFVVIGLGNPGPRYERTRHNVGFRVVERLAAKGGASFRGRLFSPYRWAAVRFGGRDFVLVEPLTYMNRSGDAFPALRRRFSASPAEMAVVADNLDLPCGACRLRRGGGSAGHNGLKSLLAAVGDPSFLRLYVGIGHPGSREGVVDHVLGEPTSEEDALLDDAVERAAAALEALADRPFDRVAEELNRRVP